MAKRILVVGVPSPPSSPGEMALVAAKVVSGFTVVRCRSPNELIPAVNQARGSDLVDVLDIFDHGAAGVQRLGSGVLFASDGDRLHDIEGRQTAETLAAHLTDTAHVRLLGCRTASGVATGAGATRGRILLAKLGRALRGRRVAFGTTTDIDSNHFNESGFIPDIEMTHLTSSLAAIDAVAPDVMGRVQNARQVFKHADDE